MNDAIINHPFLPTFFSCVLMLWPLMRLYVRVGLSRWWAMLIFTSLLIPISGMMLVFLPLAIKPWPKFPKAPEPQKPVKEAL
jgi:hypothetical protein